MFFVLFKSLPTSPPPKKNEQKCSKVAEIMEEFWNLDITTSLRPEIEIANRYEIRDRQTSVILESLSRVVVHCENSVSSS